MIKLAGNSIPYNSGYFNDDVMTFNFPPESMPYMALGIEILKFAGSACIQKLKDEAKK